MAKKKQSVKETGVQNYDGKPVLVTTERRLVIFGYAVGGICGETITLRRARCCLYWSKAMKGFLGLAKIGPDENCRIGEQAEEITLRNITAVVAVAPEAVIKWEAAPWKS